MSEEPDIIKEVNELHKLVFDATKHMGQYHKQAVLWHFLQGEARNWVADSTLWYSSQNERLGAFVDYLVRGL